MEITLKKPSVVVIPDGARRWLWTTMENGVTRNFVSLTSKEPSFLDEKGWVEDIEKRKEVRK